MLSRLRFRVAFKDSSTSWIWSGCNFNRGLWPISVSWSGFLSRSLSLSGAWSWSRSWSLGGFFCWSLSWSAFWLASRFWGVRS